MKKRYAFLLILLLFIIYVVLYRLIVPKVIFINQSGYDIYIFGNYVDDVEAANRKHSNEEPRSLSYRLLEKNQSTNYRLGFFSNKNRESAFWAKWSFPVKKDGVFIQSRMSLPDEDFGWKNITFIIDENGDYYKEGDPQNKLPLITGTRITED